jgi:hypothetical protein
MTTYTEEDKIKDKPVSFRMPKPDHDDFMRYLKRRGLNKSAVARKIIMAEVAKDKKKFPEFYK